MFRDMTKANLKVTGVFPKTDEDVSKTHDFIVRKSKKEGIRKPKVLISIDSGIAYIFEMFKRVAPKLDNRA